MAHTNVQVRVCYELLGSQNDTVKLHSMKLKKWLLINYGICFQVIYSDIIRPKIHLNNVNVWKRRGKMNLAPQKVLSWTSVTKLLQRRRVTVSEWVPQTFLAPFTGIRLLGVWLGWGVGLWLGGGRAWLASLGGGLDLSFSFPWRPTLHSKAFISACWLCTVSMA